MKKNRKDISITLVSDFENDILGAETLVYSLWNNSDIRKINILTTFIDFKESNLYKMIIFLDFDVNIFYINNNLPNFENDKFFESLKHISKTAFSKILILKYVKENTLYLDTDTLLVGKLKKRKLLKLKGHPIFVVRNGHHSPEYWFKNYENIFDSIKEVSEMAFNSGVIYFKDPQNCKDDFNMLSSSIEKNKFIYMDQAHFNFVYKKRAGYLPIEYNFPVHNHLNKNVSKPKNNIILHFASKNKPWMHNDNNDKENLYFCLWKKYNDQKNQILLNINN